MLLYRIYTTRCVYDICIYSMLVKAQRYRVHIHVGLNDENHNNTDAHYVLSPMETTLKMHQRLS